MQKCRISAMLLLFSAFASPCLCQSALAKESHRTSRIPHTQIRYKLLAKLPNSARTPEAPTVLDFWRKNERSPLVLAGLKKFDVVVEEFDQDAAKCGFFTDKLEQAVRDTLSQANIALVHKYAPEANGTIYLSVNALPDCTTNYTLGVFTSVTIKESGNKSYARVWWTELLRTGGLNPAADLEEQIIEGTKAFVDDWKLANPS